MGVPPYRETQAYVKRVLQYYRGYRAQFERETPLRIGALPAAPRPSGPELAARTASER